MFTYIRLKNFMSFKDILFNLKNGNKETKKFISIYGENGSGKSNFVNSISLLRQSIDSFQMVGNEERINELAKRKVLPEEMLDMLFSNANILNYANSCRMLECDEATTAEYGFKVGAHEGYYIISFSNKFVYEKLYYYTGKQSGVLFEINSEAGKINVNFSGKLFSDRKIETELKDEINKYWGKHTFLAILNKEMIEKNEEYIKENYLSYTFDLINMLNELTVHYKKSPYSGNEIIAKKPDNVLHNLKEGKIKDDNTALLDCSERIIKDFFTQAYADIKDVFYERRMENKEVFYKLYVKKMIGGKIRVIEFGRESAGTQSILEIIRSLLGAFCGVTVVYDEIDNGIHDLLLKSILESMSDYITGQLIITTHNTYLLESMDIKSIYVINVDYQGNKEVKCMDKFQRIQGTNNPRVMYMKGLFGGIPCVDMLDYDMILQELNTRFSAEGGE